MLEVRATALVEPNSLLEASVSPPATDVIRPTSCSRPTSPSIRPKSAGRTRVGLDVSFDEFIVA